VSLGTAFKITDFYCGAGGSSTGAVAAGAEVTNAANHWDRAIETHQINHPHTRHYLTDLLEAHPSEFTRTPVAWFSPECKTHSRGRGKSVLQPSEQLHLWNHRDPAEIRSRTTMEQVIAFTEHHRYEAVIVENVVDIKYWPPLSRWFSEMVALGYDYKVNYFNSMFFHPLNGQSDFAPQNRDRWYAVFWKRGNRAPDLDFRPLAWCEKCGENVEAEQVFKRAVFPQGLYDTTGKRGQYFYACPVCSHKRNGRQPGRVEPYYFAAWNCIDWELPITRIGDRKRPLKPNTIRRIEIGLEKYGAQPIVAELAYAHARNDRSRPTTNPMPTQTTRQSVAFIVPMKADARSGYSFQASKPTPTLTTVGAPAVLLVEMYGGGNCRQITDPVNTVTSGGTKSGLLMLPGGFVASYYGADTVAPISAPLNTVTTVDRHAFIVNMQAANPPTGTGEPLPTILTGNHKYLAQPGTVKVEDCGFRMFEPHECQDAQGFPETYDVLGNKREKVKQIGGAVTPPVAEFLVGAVRDSLAH